MTKKPELAPYPSSQTLLNLSDHIVEHFETLKRATKELRGTNPSSEAYYDAMAELATMCTCLETEIPSLREELESLFEKLPAE